nr:MAG TPA: hypothetical protein [Caudoviricetes sp.]
MQVINHPSIIFDKEDKQLIENLENFAATFDDELCTKIDCESCPCYIKCNQLFNRRPYEELSKIINFFYNFPTEEG